MRYPAIKRAASAGFTLLEVLVALLVVATALGAVMQSLTAATRHQAHLETRTQAVRVLDMQAAAYRSGRAPWPVLSEQHSVSWGGREWHLAVRPAVHEPPLADAQPSVAVAQLTLAIWPAAQPQGDPLARRVLWRHEAAPTGALPGGR